VHSKTLVSSVRSIARRSALKAGLRCLQSAGALTALQACGTLPYVRDPRLQYSPAFFSARRADRANLYLFGTLHIGLEAFYPLPVVIDQAFERSPRLAVEIDARKHWSQLVAGFRPYVRLPTGVTLADLFPADLLAEIRHFFRFPDEQWHEMQSMQPWWIANFRFGTERDRLEGTLAEFGVEQHLLAAARMGGKAVLELEQAIEQVQGLAGGSLAEQSIQLRNWFAVIKRRGGLMSDLISAWRRGDLASLAELKAETWGDQQQQTSLRRRFFSERDSRMAQQLTRLAIADESLFVAVGAYHLVGDDSLLTQLRDQGFNIERLDTDTQYQRSAAARSSRAPALL
jgi:uncharacterized protein